MKKAVLLSGGMDSAALLYLCRPSNAIFVNYGQAASRSERKAASAVADHACVPLDCIDVDCGDIGAGEMSRRAPIDGAATEFWPFRNQLLVTIAAAFCLRKSINALLLGAVQTDRLHLDGSVDFVRAIDHLLSIQEGGLRVEAPALTMTSTELIRQAKIPQEVVAWCHSCLISDLPCLNCSSCVKQRDVLQELGWYHY